MNNSKTLNHLINDLPSKNEVLNYGWKFEEKQLLDYKDVDMNEHNKRIITIY